MPLEDMWGSQPPEMNSPEAIMSLCTTIGKSNRTMNMTVTFKLWTQINCTHYYANVLVFRDCQKVLWSEQAIGGRICLGLRFQKETSVSGRHDSRDKKTRNHSLHCRPTAERAKWRKGEAKLAQSPPVMCFLQQSWASYTSPQSSNRTPRVTCLSLWGIFLTQNTTLIISHILLPRRKAD